MKNKLTRLFKEASSTNKLLSLVILILVIIFIQLFYDSDKINNINHHISKLKDNININHKTQQELEIHMDKQDKAISEIQSIQNKITTDINTLTQNQNQIEDKVIKQIKLNTDQINTNAQTLEKILKLLNTKINSPDHKTTSAHSILSTPDGYQKTDEYSISGVAPYGVILQDKSGRFLIAQINKQLSIGVINAITENYVIAGKYIITH